MQTLLASLPPLEAIQAEIRRRTRNKIRSFYPETGPLRRELYQKHLEFFRAAKEHRERALCAGNRVGKTTAAAYEITCHLTGWYPHWWEGRRFLKPVNAWAAGDTSKTVREIVQEKLLGRAGEIGTGMIPGDAIFRTTSKQGIADAIDTVHVRHVSGGVSFLGLKSYDQRRESFQGTEQHVVWLDEEPDLEIYTECLIRTMTCDGIVMLTFTPLLGFSDVVRQFFHDNMMP